MEDLTMKLRQAWMRYEQAKANEAVAWEQRNLALMEYMRLTKIAEGAGLDPCQIMGRHKRATPRERMAV